MLNRSIYFFTFQITWIQPQVHNTQIISCCVSFLPNMHRAEEHMKQQNEKVVCDERATAAKFIENCFFFVFFFFSLRALFEASCRPMCMYVFVMDSSFFFFSLISPFRVSSPSTYDGKCVLQYFFLLFLLSLRALGCCWSFHFIIATFCFGSAFSLLLHSFSGSQSLLLDAMHIFTNSSMCVFLFRRILKQKKRTSRHLWSIQWTREKFFHEDDSIALVEIKRVSSYSMETKNILFFFFSTSIFISWFCYFFFILSVTKQIVYCVCVHTGYSLPRSPK